MSEEFVVHDRRLFSKDGQINAAARDEPAAAEEPAAAPQPSEAARPAPEEPAGARSAPRNQPPASFTGLLVGLATSALINLGESPEDSEPPQVDLAAAKQAIDLLVVLKAKTKGNLVSEEEALLETLLYDLRLKYVKASQ